MVPLTFDMIALAPMVQATPVRMPKGQPGWRADNAPPPTEAQIARAWADAQAKNPALFDGPVLIVTSAEPRIGLLALGVARYARVIAQRTVGDLGLWTLGAKACITGETPSGERHLLLLRRAPHTSAYPGQWEIGPAGGVPAELLASGQRAGGEVIASALQTEAQEELGIDLWSHCVPPVAETRAWLYQDVTAYSVDVIVELRWREPIDPNSPPDVSRGDGEYTEARWLSIDLAPTLLATGVLDDAPITPPTRAVLEAINSSQSLA